MPIKNIYHLKALSINYDGGLSGNMELSRREGYVPDPPQEPLKVSSSTVAATTTSLSPANLAYPSGGIEAGDLLVISASCRSAILLTPSGWTKIREAATGNFRCAVYAKTATGSESGSQPCYIDSEGSLRSVIWTMHHFRNVVIPATDHLGAVGDNNSMAAPSITGNANGILVTAFGATYGTTGGNITACPTGMLSLHNHGGSQNQKLRTCYKVLTATGPTGVQTPTFSLNSPTWTAVSVAFPNEVA